MRKIKNFFKELKAWAEFVRTGNTEGLFAGPTAVVEKDGDRYALKTTRGDVIEVYARKRDAVRGAERRGLEIA